MVNKSCGVVYVGDRVAYCFLLPWMQSDKSDRALLLVDDQLRAIVEEDAGTTEEIAVDAIVGELCLQHTGIRVSEHCTTVYFAPSPVHWQSDLGNQRKWAMTSRGYSAVNVNYLWPVYLVCVEFSAI